VLPRAGRNGDAEASGSDRRRGADPERRGAAVSEPLAVFEAQLGLRLLAGAALPAAGGAHAALAGGQPRRPGRVRTGRLPALPGARFPELQPGALRRARRDGRIPAQPPADLAVESGAAVSLRRDLARASALGGCDRRGTRGPRRARSRPLRVVTAGAYSLERG